MRDSASARRLIDPQTLDDPYPFYRELRQTAPVWQVPGTKIVVVTRHALLEEAARRVEDFSSHLTGVLYRSWNGTPARLTRDSLPIQALATADPPAHALHRNAVFPELVARKMSAMAPDIEQVTDACIGRLLAARSGDFMHLVANPLPMTVVSRLVGFKGSDIDRLLRAAFDSTAVVDGTMNLFQLLFCLVRSAMIQRWISGQLRAASRDGSDILSAIRRSVDDGTLRTMEGRAILHILLAAGGESTTSLLGNAVRRLAEDPELQAMLRAQPERIPAFLEEVLRLESPFRYHLRSVPKDTRLGDVDIPRGATVLMFWSAGNRDPEVFDRADEIDLDRPRKHMTFGRGIHTCVGAPLARLEGAIVLRALLARTRDIALDASRPPAWVKSLQVRRHEHLTIRVTPA
ncbi:MAG: cytochrome P450 [Sinimarinibacterium flocculans]|uniref:cytochrome P450 n=1 Tax=Sinimarinibacterium flocculans TaxID=985250 RepID=UPI003C46ABF9